MKVLVYSHSLQIGGSQITAVNLAAAMHRAGHDVVVAGPPGPLAHLAVDLGVPVHEIHGIGGRRPSLRGAWSLRRLARAIRPDLVHAYSHSASLEAYLATYAIGSIPLLCSERGQVVPRPFPKDVPLILAHRPLELEARRSGHSEVYLMRVMVDTEANNPSIDGEDFTVSHDIPSSSPIIVLVSRLAVAVKLEGILRTIDAFGGLPDRLGARLVIVGDGDARPTVEGRADDVNRRFRERRVILVGAMEDPRPAYAAADVVIGMQGSALRGMAFGKPTIIVGERGFSEIVSPATFPRFLEHGFTGTGNDGSNDDLRKQLVTLLEDGELRDRLGRYSRGAVCASNSLEANAEVLRELYRDVSRRKPGFRDRIRAILWLTAMVGRSTLRLRRTRARLLSKPVPGDSASPTDRQRTTSDDGVSALHG